MLRNCPSCQREISRQAGACPHCGHDFNAGWKRAGKILTVFLLLVVLFSIIFGVYDAFLRYGQYVR